jgi:uncharacterized protein YukE
MRQPELVIPISPGELVDRIGILQIKAVEISDPAKLDNITTELAALEPIWRGAAFQVTDAERRQVEAAAADLLLINRELWRVEDSLRVYESRGDFGDQFILAARSVYQLNDERAELKKRINTILGSWLVEEKSYTDQGRAQ